MLQILTSKRWEWKKWTKCQIQSWRQHLQAISCLYEESKLEVKHADEAYKGTKKTKSGK